MVRVSTVWMVLVAVVLQLAVAGCAHAPQPSRPTNSVVAFLDGADFQAEVDDQRREVLRGLNDLLSQPPDRLPALRYAGDDGQVGARDLVKLLQDHFLPRRSVALDRRYFYAQVVAPEAQAVIREQRDRLRSAMDHADER